MIFSPWNYPFLLSIQPLISSIAAGNCTILKLSEHSPHTTKLLCYLIDNAGVALSRGQILNNVWNYDYFGDERTVDTHVKMLRGNLKEYRKFIVTLRGLGYKFEA